MSTFKGYVKEFPDIRIDYFRALPPHPPPLACFLSHVHSDHLQGLESFRSPFIYCSAATKELILRIEKYPARLNFAKGVFETRLVQYKHLKTLLRPIPLNVPTVIELAPGRELTVTLLDANHCPGSVMFLIEGDGKAILYTGDVRAESWWVDFIARLPSVLPFSTGLRRLDMIYLDTTFATKSNPYRSFPSKQDGIKELLEKITLYPSDAIFYFQSWTFGYEQVWLALSAFLKSQVHVDEYKMGLFQSLSTRRGSLLIEESSGLCGFQFGNAYHPGCLTDSDDVRIHACERDHGCTVPSSQAAIRIIPVINRLPSGEDILEPGAGGGYGDLKQTVKLDLRDPDTLARLLALCERIENDELKAGAISTLQSYARGPAPLLLVDNGDSAEAEVDLRPEQLLDMLREIKSLIGQKTEYSNRQDHHIKKSNNIQCSDLPSSIRFPYSRHSSYEELCNLIRVFRPAGIYPCTVDESDWRPTSSMEHLFGHLCSSSDFPHDREMIEKYPERLKDESEIESNEDPISSQVESSQVTNPSLTSDNSTSQRVYTAQAILQDVSRDSHLHEDRSKNRDSKKRRNIDHNQLDVSVQLETAHHLSPDSDGVPPMASSSLHSYQSPPKDMRPASLLGQTRESESTQISLADSAFSSQGSGDGLEKASKKARRKEAYLAAKGKADMDWKSYSTLQGLGREDDSDELE